MVGIGAALGHHLDLTAGRAVEIRSLSGGAHLEFFDTLDGSGNYSGGRATGCASALITIAGGVSGVGTSHVVAVVAAIKLEAVLIGCGSGHISSQRYTYLQHRKRRCIAAEVREHLERLTGDGGPHGSI